jgi:tRNA1(Val) A37 N6-methylase TrmN6
MVLDEEYDQAIRLLQDSGELDAVRPQNSDDTLLGGRLALRQPKSGYRVAIDPVLLAAAVSETDGLVLDAGCGTGAASLCYAHRVPGATVTGLELRADWADIAEENAHENGLAARVTIVRGDLLQPPRELIPESFDEVMANPPSLPASRADMRDPPADAPATVEGDAKLGDWIDFCLSMARPQGGITLIQRADRLDEILTFLHGRAGAIVVFPLWPHAVETEGGADARRVIVRARKGAKAPTRLAAGLALHGEDGAYTGAAEAILRDGGALLL